MMEEKAATCKLNSEISSEKKLENILPKMPYGLSQSIQQGQWAGEQKHSMMCSSSLLW
jgi:hypothetical protein